LDGRPPLEIKEFGIFLTFARFSPIAGSPRGFGVWPKIGWASLHQNARVDIRPHRQVMVDFSDFLKPKNYGLHRHAHKLDGLEGVKHGSLQ
jgi:hypothetical protein